MRTLVFAAYLAAAVAAVALARTEWGFSTATSDVASHGSVILTASPRGPFIGNPNPSPQFLGKWWRKIRNFLKRLIAAVDGLFGTGDDPPPPPPTPPPGNGGSGGSGYAWAEGAFGASRMCPLLA